MFAILHRASLAVALIAAASCGSPSTAARDAYWVAIEDHGDKPGVAYELWFSGTVCVRGTVSVLDPRGDGDLSAAALPAMVRIVAPMQAIETGGTTVRFRVPENFMRSLPESGEISFIRAAAGVVGTRIDADVTLVIDESTRAPWFDSEATLSFERIE